MREINLLDENSPDQKECHAPFAVNIKQEQCKEKALLARE